MTFDDGRASSIDALRRQQAKIRDNGQAKNKTLGRLVPIPWSGIQSLPPREPIVGGFLDRAAMSVVFGASNSGKTFWTLDLAVSIALGRSWNDRKIRQGTVVYLAAEGGLGIKERLRAFEQYHRITAEGVPLFIVPEPIDLCKSDADVRLLLQRMAALPAGPSIELIVVDTLSRALAGGNENGADDMGRFVQHCDRLRMEINAHVCIVHHVGKDESRGARGHSLLRAAVDTEIEVTKGVSGVATAEVVKQRDRASGDTFSFRLEPVDIGRDEQESTITSCVVIPTDRPTEPTKKALPKGPLIALRALAEAIDEQGQVAPVAAQIPAGVKVVSQDAWRQQSYLRGITSSDEPRARQQAFNRASKYLILACKVGSWDGTVWLAT